LLDNSNNIEGRWFEESAFYSVKSPSDTIRYLSRLEITFSVDQQMETLRLVFDAPTGVFWGYRYASFGYYKVNSNRLTMVTEKSISNDDNEGLYAAEKLVPVPIEPEILQVTFQITGNKLRLIYPPCPPNANCIDSVTYERMAN